MLRLARWDSGRCAGEELKVIVFPGGGNWPLWVAQSLGLFARHGLNVDVVPTPNSTFQLTGLSKGDFDIAMNGLVLISSVLNFGLDATDEDGDGNPDQDPPPLVRVFIQYYPGHGYFTNYETSWAPIMGSGPATLTQWSFAEYINATNDEEGTEPRQDDLTVITTQNGFGYRDDDQRAYLYRTEDLGKTWRSIAASSSKVASGNRIIMVEARQLARF
ncbi:MAG: hypothetical protein HC871_06510 [Rhizobiales bacterium]|nr:hypothetical protein [Hyphomicrobiales bacterium]